MSLLSSHRIGRTRHTRTSSSLPHLFHTLSSKKQVAKVVCHHRSILPSHSASTTLAERRHRCLSKRCIGACIFHRYIPSLLFSHLHANRQIFSIWSICMSSISNRHVIIKINYSRSMVALGHVACIYHLCRVSAHHHVVQRAWAATGSSTQDHTLHAETTWTCYTSSFT